MRELLTELSDGVAVVTMNRPERRNALNASLRRALWRGLRELDEDPDVRAIVLTGADPVFSAGVDLTELGGEGEGGARGALGAPVPPLATPTIAAVNGPAVTGGLEVALRCHLRIASDRAHFADTHARVGVLPAWGLTTLLPRLVGPGRAREMSATGNYIDARTAAAWGLVNRIAAHDDLLPEARRLAADIASADPDCVRRLFAVYDEVAELLPTAALAHEEAASRAWIIDLAGRGGVPDRRDAVIRRGRQQVAPDPRR